MTYSVDPLVRSTPSASYLSAGGAADGLQSPPKASEDIMSAASPDFLLKRTQYLDPHKMLEVVASPAVSI